MTLKQVTKRGGGHISTCIDRHNISHFVKMVMNKHSNNGMCANVLVERARISENDLRIGETAKDYYNLLEMCFINRNSYR